MENENQTTPVPVTSVKPAPGQRAGSEPQAEGTWSRLRRSKKARLGVIVALIVIAGLIAFFFEKTRLWMFGLIALLLVGLGMEAANTDYDLGKMIETGSVQESKVLRDKEGNIVPAGTMGAKYTDEYNCDDFTSQPESQRFFDRAGGVSQDTNRLDGDKDGTACESLPKGKK